MRQSLDYRYHIRGWLSKINDTEQVGGDYFAQELRYAQGGNNAQYNGNISEVRWVNAQGGLQSYRYGYDKADRLTEALHRYSTGLNQWQQGAYSTKQISYDGNGNILGLQRFGRGSVETKVLDFLAYSYQGNRLVKVKERGVGDKTQGFVDGANLDEEYFYDAAGNLIQDENKGLRNITYDPLLNLPLVVTTDAGTIYYRYDAVGNKLQQKVKPVEGEAVTTDYVGAFEYQNNTLALLHHPEGRVLFAGEARPVYHYDLKDHLGNIRTTFSSEMSTTVAVATMEEDNAGYEETLFQNLSESRVPSGMHNTTPETIDIPEPNQVAALNATVGKMIGPARSMRVQPGEKVRLSVKARYEEFSEDAIDGAEGTLAALLSAFGPTTVGLEGSQTYQAISSALGSTALMSKDETGVPHAYLNYLLFDDDFNPIEIGFKDMTPEGRVTESSLDAVETISLEEIEISESGYLYTWVSNESNWNVTVYFDDFTIEHDTYIVSSQDYYAFGAVHNAEKRSVGLNNKHQYQGKEWQADLGLGLLNFHARQYDPYLGRFTSTDPMAHSYASASPYAGMLNNPVCIIDPDGREPITLATAIIVGGIIGAYTGGAIANDGELNPLQWNYTDRGAWKTYAGIVGGGVLGIIAGASVYGVIAGEISLKVGLITPIATIGVTGHTNNWFQDFSWTTSAGGQGSIQSDNPITSNSLLMGSNAQQSVYTGGYAQTSFNDPMQDYITDQILKRSGVRILPDLAVDSRYNSSLFGVHDRQTGTSIDWLNASGGVVGIFGMGFSNLDKLHPGYATAAKVGLGLGFASAFISGYQFSQNPTYANGFDLLMNGTSLVPGGAAVGVPYFILNTVVQGATNKTIGQHFFGDKRVIE